MNSQTLLVLALGIACGVVAGQPGSYSGQGGAMSQFGAQQQQFGGQQQQQQFYGGGQQPGNGNQWPQQQQQMQQGSQVAYSATTQQRPGPGSQQGSFGRPFGQQGAQDCPPGAPAPQPLVNNFAQQGPAPTMSQQGMQGTGLDCPPGAASSAFGQAQAPLGGMNGADCPDGPPGMQRQRQSADDCDDQSNGWDSQTLGSSSSGGNARRGSTSRFTFRNRKGSTAATGHAERGAIVSILAIGAALFIAIC